MDFADAPLIYLANRESLNAVLTVDHSNLILIASKAANDSMYCLGLVEPSDRRMLIDLTRCELRCMK